MGVVDGLVHTAAVQCQIVYYSHTDSVAVTRFTPFTFKQLSFIFLYLFVSSDTNVSLVNLSENLTYTTNMFIAGLHVTLSGVTLIDLVI